jgi:hypothetical protein
MNCSTAKSLRKFYVYNGLCSIVSNQEFGNPRAIVGRQRIRLLVSGIEQRSCSINTQPTTFFATTIWSTRDATYWSRPQSTLEKNHDYYGYGHQ